MRIHPLLSVVAAAWTAAACAHQSDNPGVTTTHGASVDGRARNVADRLAAARCETASSCPGRPVYPSTEWCTQALAAPSAAEAHLDRCATVSETKLERCLAEVRATPCAQLDKLSACSVCADEAEEGLP